MEGQREKDGTRRYILKLKEHPYYKRLPWQDAFRLPWPDGIPWSMKFVNDGRKVCCNVFYNSTDKMTKCTSRHGTGVINLETYFICFNCYKHCEDIDYDESWSLHEKYHEAIRHLEQRRCGDIKGEIS